MVGPLRLCVPGQLVPGQLKDGGDVVTTTLVTARRRPVATVAVALALAGLVVAAAVVDVVYGVALLAAVAYLPAALRDVRLAVVLWVPLLFLVGLPAGNMAAKGGGLVVLVAWVGHLRGTARPEGLPRQLVLLGGVLLLMLGWWSASVVWAVEPGRAASDLWHWYAVGLLYAVIATSFDDVFWVRALAAAFVVGGLCSAAMSLASGGSMSAVGSSSLRAQGAAGDPNFLASWLVSAAILGLGLASTLPGRGQRRVVLGSVVVLAGVLVATQSRGAFVAVAVTLLLALLLLKGRRPQIGAAASLCVGVLLAFTYAFPAAAQHVTASDRGDGRYDLWTVAWRVARSNPLRGVGLHNFTSVAPDYMREVSPLRGTYLLVGSTHVVHNTYLQLLAELGAVGLVLFCAVALGSLGAAHAAARTFRLHGDEAGASMAEAAMLAGAGALVAGFFLSAGVDQLLWVILGIGPALLVRAVALGPPQQLRLATQGSSTWRRPTQSTPDRRSSW